MIITKAEAMKAVIDGVPIQHRFGCEQGIWIDSFSPGFTLIQKIISIEESTSCEFRLKPAVKTISYRCFLHTNLAGAVSVSVCNSTSTQKECEEYSDFISWLGDTVTVEIGE